MIKVIVFILMLSSLGLAVLLFITSRGTDRDYAIDYTLPLNNEWTKIGSLEVGVGIRDVTPVMENYDTWTDIDGDGSYNPKVDEYLDRNGNGIFDFVWLAGFGQQRPAQGVNDQLWSRAIAFRNNGITIVLVSIDSIGITYDRYIPIRKMIERERNDITHVSFAATHTHNAPDTIGLWSYRLFFNSHFDDEYIELLQQRVCDSVIDAVNNLAPSDTVLAQAYVPRENFIRDSRPPIVVDHQLPVAWFKNKSTGDTIATLTSWGMHPEGFGSKNLLISSDFIHYYRQAMENGLSGQNGFEGFGGKAIFFTGPVGGLMTQLQLPIVDRFGEIQDQNGKEKSQSQGENLAILAARALRNNSKALEMDQQQVAVSAKTFYFPIGWPLKIMVGLGIVHPGVYGLPFSTRVRSEINAIRIGSIEILTTPGEIFPEIVDGGIETPVGADISTDPVEVPPLRKSMRGVINMNFNLGMDEVGYLVPISQWDRTPPYTYDYQDAPYGEVYVGDPKVSPLVHQNSIEVLQRLHRTLSSTKENNK